VRTAAPICAGAAGFADQAHFSRKFALTYGMPARRYALLHAGG